MKKHTVKYSNQLSFIPNTMKKHIAVLSGDGVGPEIIQTSITVLNAIAKKFHHEFVYTEALVGGIAIDQVGDPFPAATQKICKESDAILFGAIGDPKFDHDPTAKVRPEQGLLKMRKTLGLYANVRPITVMPGSEIKSPLKPEIIAGVDFVVVRELTGGAYFGEPRGRSSDGERAFDTIVYTKDEVTRVVKFALDLARSRRKKLTVVDKANVLETSRLWRQTVQEMTKDEKEISIDYMFVDNAAMQIASPWSSPSSPTFCSITFGHSRINECGVAYLHT
jgi:3-isopropylmalate dehydrogenase